MIQVGDLVAQFYLKVSKKLILLIVFSGKIKLRVQEEEVPFMRGKINRMMYKAQFIYLIIANLFAMEFK